MIWIDLAYVLGYELVVGVAGKVTKTTRSYDESGQLQNSPISAEVLFLFSLLQSYVVLALCPLKSKSDLNE